MNEMIDVVGGYMDTETLKKELRTTIFTFAPKKITIDMKFVVRGYYAQIFIPISDFERRNK